MITVRQFVSTALGFTHASSVIPFARSSEGASGTVTQLLLPLNASAPPKRPPLDQAVFETVPLFPCPDASATVEPEPSSNAYAATSAVAAGAASPRVVAPPGSAPSATASVATVTVTPVISERL